MSENANNIPLDDEDILDLTVVAEPGKSAAKDNDPPEMGAPDSPADFGADLDALLDSLGADGRVIAPAAKAVTEKPVAAPIADQTPVDHTVDPDEEIAMPEMSDIDSLLAGLGAENPTAATTAPMPEFDGILAQAQAAEAKKAEEEATAMPAEPAAPIPPKTATATPGDVPGALAPDAEDEAGEELDLNELDALLDDILATAPEMNAAAGTASAPVAATGEVPAEAPLPLREKETSDVIPVPDQAIMPAGESVALAERVQRLEESVAVLESEKMPETMVESLVDAKLDGLLAPDSPFLERICNEIRNRFAEGNFKESLEKMAAAAAAKVIHEEIATLMREDE